MSDFDDKLSSILSSPEAMGKIMDLAKSFSGESHEKESAGNENKNTGSSPGFGGIDPKILGIMSRVLNSTPDSAGDKAQLLNCMKPFLRDDRKEKVDKAVQIARMARIAKAAFSEFSGGDLNL